MRRISNLSLLQIEEATDIAQTRSEVLLDQKPTGLIVSGKILEAAVEVSPGRYVLFLTDDVIYEESLTVVLCSLTAGIEEIITLGGAYSSGLFQQLIISDNRLSFRFIGDAIWHIEIENRPRFKLPFLGDPKGVKRKNRLGKIMNITTTQG